MTCSPLSFKMLALAGLLALAAGCEAPPAIEPLSGTKDAAVLASEALAAGDYETAARQYRTALTKRPESFPAHYGLAIAASSLDERDEAAREFEWIVNNGVPGSPEVEAARRWLAEPPRGSADGLAAQPKGRRPRDG